MEHIHVRINEEGTLRNQRFAFSDRFTLVSELLQNARRAGATLIEVSHDPQTRTLRVLDNGHGIDDFSKLLTFNESGWNEDIQSEEHPFGAGFSRCLYAATRCMVTSRGRRIDFDTAQALAKAPIAVETVGDEETQGTLVELEGVDLPDLASRIETLCKGFAVPVEFGGARVKRQHALAHLRTQTTEVGEVQLAGIDTGAFAVSVVAYLQGFQVMYLPNHLSWCELPNVVHLDSKTFLARLPDRDTLIDADIQEVKVRAQIRRSWREELERRKAKLPAAEFVENYFEVMRYHQHLDLLNDVDVLPRAACEQVSGYPIRAAGSEGKFLERPSQPLTRGEIEANHPTRLVQLDWPDGDNAAKWMFVRGKGYTSIQASMLDAPHWAHAHVMDLDAAEVVVQAINEGRTAIMTGRQVDAEVILCDEIHICIGQETVVVVNDGLYHEGVLYIPAGERSGKAVRQCSSYLDEQDRFLKAEMLEDMDALVLLITRLRMSDPAQALRSLFGEMHSSRFAQLRGLCFRVRIGGTYGEADSVELLD